MARHPTGLAALLALGLCLAAAGTPAAARGDDQLAGRNPGESGTLDGVLSAYLGGDFNIIERTFVRSTELRDRLRLNRPRDLERWLGSWDRGKALLLLELARTSSRVAPHYVAGVVGAGRRYVAAARDANQNPNDTAGFVRSWHRTAVAVLQGASDPVRVEEHVAELAPANGGGAGSLDARLLLARAVAQEQRCWAQRPSLIQAGLRIHALLEAAGVRVPDDAAGPFGADRQAALARHSACLREAVSRFETVARLEDVAAEALVRGGWTLIQDGRPKEAIEWLDAAMPQDDRDLAYWHGLFRGRALEALARPQDAATAYRAALGLYPNAQSAGLGLTIALMQLDRAQEADEIARSVRERAAATPDPWLHYLLGDHRFSGGWIESLRAAVR